MNISSLAEKIKQGIKNPKVFIFNIHLLPELSRRLIFVIKDLSNNFLTKKFSKKQKILVLVLIVLALILPFHFSKADIAATVANILAIPVLLIVYIIFGIFQILAFIGLWIAMQLLGAAYDPALYNAVIGTTAAGSAFIDAGWKFTRDIANLFFIFILLVIAFGTILRLPSYNLKNLLPKLLIAAFLINFSKVFTMLVIDIANVFMYGIGTWVDPTSGSSGLSYLYKVIETQMGNILSPATVGYALFSGQAISHIINILALFVFTVATMFVLLALAAFLVIRIAALSILIILSPAAFICSVLPQTQKWASKWWEELVNYSIFGPIFVFFLYLSSEVAKAVFTSALPTMSLPSMKADIQVSGLSWFISAVIPYIIVLVFLLAGLSFSRSLGIYGAQAISGFTTGAIGGIAKTATGYSTASGWVRRRYGAWKRKREEVAEEKARRSPFATKPFEWEQRIRKGIKRGAGWTVSTTTGGKFGKGWGKEEERILNREKAKRTFQLAKDWEEEGKSAQALDQIAQDTKSSQEEVAAAMHLLAKKGEVTSGALQNFANVITDAQGNIEPAFAGLAETVEEVVGKTQNINLASEFRQAISQKQMAAGNMDEIQRYEQKVLQETGENLETIRTTAPGGIANPDYRQAIKEYKQSKLSTSEILKQESSAFDYSLVRQIVTNPAKLNQVLRNANYTQRGAIIRQGRPIIQSLLNQLPPPPPAGQPDPYRELRNQYERALAQLA